MRRYLFSGPSLPDAAAVVAGDDITVLPPVAAGQLLRMPLKEGDLVGIVDGYFHQTRAVRHKEILAVLAAGARVLGAASIGALRAAELHSLGMEGIGGIYRDYRDGVLVADDEVALAHGPVESGYRAMSEPLVNLRATLWGAEQAGVIDSEHRELLVGRLAQMPYAQRTYPRLAELALEIGLTEAVSRELRAYCREHPVNRKRSDALALVRELRMPTTRTPAPRVELSHTIFLHAWELAATGEDTGDDAGWVADLALLRICQVFAVGYPELHRRTVLDRLASECVEQCAADPDQAAERIALDHGVHRGVYPRLDEDPPLDFLHDWLTPTERRELSPHEQVVTFLVRGFRVTPGIVDDIGAIAALRRDHHTIAQARQLAAWAAEVNARAQQQHTEFSVAAIPARRIIEWVAERWSTTPEDLELRALDRGLDSVDTLVAAARPYYLLAKYNPGLTLLSLDSRGADRCGQGVPRTC